MREQGKPISGPSSRSCFGWKAPELFGLWAQDGQGTCVGGASRPEAPVGWDGPSPGRRVSAPEAPLRFPRVSSWFLLAPQDTHFTLWSPLQETQTEVP